MSKKKKKKVKRPPGLYAKESHVIRVSPELYEELIKLSSKENESYDSIIRRILGNKKKKSQELYLINDGTHAFSDEAVARGEAIRLAVRTGKKPSPVVRVKTSI